MDEAIKNGKTGYCPAAGIPELRKALAQDVSTLMQCAINSLSRVESRAHPFSSLDAHFDPNLSAQFTHSIH